MPRTMPALSPEERAALGLRAAGGHMFRQDKVWSRYSNDKVDIAFKQLIKANDPLRTGSYSKTLTFTLSTTTP